jgi:N-acetylmuramoyl-L-alanine amidase
MSKKWLIIWGVAHSDNVAGKCSPDGRHHEPVWSKARCNSLLAKCNKLGIPSMVVQPKADDLQGRMKFNNECEKAGTIYENILVIPIHNNAAGSGKWMNAHGWCIYTSPGYTKSDPLAIHCFQMLMAEFPELSVRYNSIKDPDFEAAFTVLMGNYKTFLIEWLFQDDKDDLEIIENAGITERFENVLINFVQEITK